MSKVNLGTVPSTQNMLSVLLDSVCAVTALITICDKSQIATAGIPELSQFVTVAICDGSKHNFSDRFHSNRGYTPKCRKHAQSTSDPFKKVSWVHWLWALWLMNIHINIYTSEITPKWEKIQLFIFMSKLNLDTVPSTQNTFSVLLDSVCAVTALITNCVKSQIKTAVIPELSHFVTVAICDGSKHNFSDRFYNNRGYTPKCRKHVHIKSDPFKKVSWVHRLWA